MATKTKVKKQQTVLGVLLRILIVLTKIESFLIKSHLVTPPGAPASIYLNKISDYEQLRLSPTRFEKLPDGWFRDKFISAVISHNYDIAPASMDKKLTWQEGQDYAATFSKDGFTASQLDDFFHASIVDRTKHDPAIIDCAKVLGFKTDDYYWTPITHAGVSSCAWIVSFFNGDVGGGGKGVHYCVRPVRRSSQ